MLLRPLPVERLRFDVEGSEAIRGDDTLRFFFSVGPVEPNDARDAAMGVGIAPTDDDASLSASQWGLPDALSAASPAMALLCPPEDVLRLRFFV